MPNRELKAALMLAATIGICGVAGYYRLSTHSLPSTQVQISPSVLLQNNEVQEITVTPINSINKDALAYAIAQVESSGGSNIKARFEPGFLKRYGNSGLMPELRKRFGDRDAASSYGRYQIMLVVSWENNYKFTPAELSQDDNNRKVYDKIVSKLISKYGDDESNLSQICLRYNGGADKSYPIKVRKYYDEFKGTPR